ncbi:MAG: ABC transporter substrate-binding protein [Phaeovulum sp.]|uniref:ABC transporter substrate-binding protein n=1 Tax=Phaeovulum sp. TaxID=2934796 RepID=UPI00273585B8|nr:ABC transporter substrate-binding protein [Phaeovulum sp.]MDP3860243.1 ABC transporter substrate-binding protein [Phaeovulum sp.]
MSRILATAFTILAFASPVTAQTELRIAIDGPISGASAAYVFADDSGIFEAEGLNVDVRPTRSALDAVSRVAMGTYAMGIVDFPTFAEYVTMNPGASAISVMVIHDRAAFTVVGLKSHGITSVADLAGHVVGYDSESLMKFRMLNLANSNGLSLTDFTLKHRDPAALAAALAAGEVDAVAGLSYDLLPDLARLGVSADDLTVLPMADNGLVLYGQVLVVNSDFAKSSSATVSKLVAAVLKGWKATMADPDAAIAAVVARKPELDPGVEAERLRMIIAENVLTPYVLENGFGTPSQARQEWNVAQLQDNPDFINSEDRDLYFSTNFLPSTKDRALK